MRIPLHNTRLIDGTGRPAQDGVGLLIENDTIMHAGPLAAADAPAVSIDAAGRAVIPGLVEAHNDVRQVADLGLDCPAGVLHAGVGEERRAPSQASTPAGDSRGLHRLSWRPGRRVVV